MSETRLPKQRTYAHLECACAKLSSSRQLRRTKQAYGRHRTNWLHQVTAHLAIGTVPMISAANRIPTATTEAAASVVPIPTAASRTDPTLMNQPAPGSSSRWPRWNLPSDGTRRPPGLATHTRWMFRAWLACDTNRACLAATNGQTRRPPTVALWDRRQPGRWGPQQRKPAHRTATPAVLCRLSQEVVDFVTSLSTSHHSCQTTVRCVVPPRGR